MKRFRIISIATFCFCFLSAFMVFGQNKINCYEYWYDNNYAGKVVYTTGSPTEEFLVSGGMDASTLSPGLHIFHIRFKDTSGKWSSVMSRFIEKVSNASALTNQIASYEYWFDDNYAGKVVTTVPLSQELLVNGGVDASSLSPGFHIFHIRFKDAGNTWSSVESSFFEKTGHDESLSNLITAYRYWFDYADTAMYAVQLSTPVSPYSLTGLDLTGLPKGNHSMHIQFLDTLENWSCIITDTIYKFPEVVADFTPDNYLLCDSGWVNFTNNSFDADTFRWDFGDATTSTLENPAHFFNTPGTFPVMLIAYDTLEGVIDTAIVDVSVAVSPSVNLGSDTAICPSSITLDAWNADCTYNWSDLSTDSVIHVNSAGVYSVTVTDQWGCFDIDSINVLVNPAPIIDLGNDTIICDYNSVVLDAGPGFTIYSWNTGATTQTITANMTGTYIAEVTNSYGCVNSDTIIVTTDPCTSISEISGNNQFVIFPNPNDGIFSIQNISCEENPCLISVNDISGREIITFRNISLKKGNSYVIDVSELASGIYLLKISSDNLNIKERIIISR